jgi:DNA repair protein RadC
MRGKPRLRSLQPVCRDPFLAYADRVRPRALRYDPTARVITSTRAIALLVPRFARAEVEELHVIALDPDLVLKGIEMVARGSVDHVEVEVREVFVSAVRARASFVVVGHNHPGGPPEPSQADQDLTERLVVAGHLLGIPLLDHIVVGEADSYVSFADRRLIRCPVRDYAIPF